MNTREKRFRRTFLLGLQALGVFTDSEQWEQFKNQDNVDGPFEELLGEGKFDEGLCVFRAHAPFGEVDHQRVPEILSRALPRAIGHKFSESSLQNLLLWIEDEVTPQLHSSEARDCLHKLTSSVARDVAYKALASVEAKNSSDTTGITRSLQLASTIAGCGVEKGESVLQGLLTETIELIKEHGLLRPSRVILQSDEMCDRNRARHVYFSDVEAMLLRGVDRIDQEMTDHIRPWCNRVGLDADEAILSFLANPDLVEDERWTKLLDLVVKPIVRVEATILFLRKAQPPFQPFVYKVIEDAIVRDPGSAETWQKESRSLDIRAIAAKYGCGEWFDLSKHLRMLQMHVCATTASCKDVESFTGALEDAFALCSPVELPNIASHLLALIPECGFAFDPITYVEFVTTRLTVGGMRYSVVQEAIQACMLGIQDQIEVDDSMNHEQMEVNQDEGEEEEESAEERYAHLGLALVRYAREELDLSVLYIDLGQLEDLFQQALVAATRRLSLNSSAVSDLGGMANVSKTVSIAEMSNISCGSKEALNSVIIMNTEAHCLPDACDRLSDALVLFDVKEACNKSLVSTSSDVNDELRWAFRDCPNVIYSRDFCPKLQVALDESRSSHHQLNWTRDSAERDLETVARSLDANGALQTSFRVRAASYTRWFSKSVSDSLEDLMFRMASAALQRPALDERLIFGYLTSLSSKDSATLVFKAETKRLNDEFLYLQQVKARQEYQTESGQQQQQQEENKDEVETEFDFGRFERLSCLGKNIGKAFAKKSLLEESQRNERTAKWLIVLSNRVSLDKLRFIRAQSDYLLSTASQLFSSFFSKSDFSFTESKLDQMKEFVNDFSRELNMQMEQCLSHCMCDLLLRIDPSHFDQGVLSDTLVRWSRHADVNYLIEEVNNICLSRPSTNTTRLQQQQRHWIKMEPGLDGSQYASLIRIATELLLNLAPERDSFLKRTQLLGEPWIAGGDIARLIRTPIEALLHAKVHQPQNRVQIAGGNSLLDMLAMVHSALEMESTWDAFCVEYCSRVMEMENGKLDFKESLLPILDSVSSSNEQKWELLLGAAGLQNQQSSSSSSNASSMDAMMMMLQSTKDRLLCLKYISKNQKRVPSKLLNQEALELLIKELEIRFLFERLNIPFHDSELSHALSDHEQQTTVHMSIVRLLLERASLVSPDADVFEAARLIIHPQTKTALLACVKRLILDWIIVPFGYLPTPEQSIAVEKENVNHHYHNNKSSSKSKQVVSTLSSVMEENESHLVRVIARSLRFVGDEESFLRKIAYGQGPRQMFTNLSRTRALKILRLFQLATEPDLLELSRRERMSRYEECRRELNGAWKQIPEQIFGEGVGKLQVAEGLLRDLPDKHPLQSALFILMLVKDALQEEINNDEPNNNDDDKFIRQQHRSSLLIKACEAVLSSNEPNRFESLLNHLNNVPVDLLQLIEPNGRVWDSLNDHIVRSLQSLPTPPLSTADEQADTKMGEQQKQNVLHQAISFIGLLERCPHDDVIVSNGERLKPRIATIWPFLARRIEMLLMRITLEA